VIGHQELTALEERVDAALDRADPSGLRVLGFGEISLVLGVPDAEPAWAAKRLPPFTDDAGVDAFIAVFDRYLATLTERGVDVVETTVERIPRPDGRVVVYCVQPVLSTTTLAPAVVASGADTEAEQVLRAIVATVHDVVDERVGLDAQLSNWAWVDGRLRYFDVTTPVLRDAHGASELDVSVFLASFPWALRPALARLVVPGIIARYHAPRTVILDLAANLHKEHLERWIPLVINSADFVDPALTEAEVRKDYTSDARLWEVIQRIRRVDRAWQRRVRRRPYPFLLPEHIER
jgi:hypothetical protein